MHQAAGVLAEWLDHAAAQELSYADFLHGLLEEESAARANAGTQKLHRREHMMASGINTVENDRRSLDFERESLRRDLAEWLDPLMTALAFLTLALLLVQFTIDLTPGEAAWIDSAQGAIWLIFLLEFVVEVLLACDKRRYLRENWFIGITVLLPALRVIRVLRVFQLLRHINTLWLLVRIDKTIQGLQRIVPGRETAYLVLLTTLIVAIGTATIYHFELGQPNSQIHTLGDALWWAACLVTTINNGLDPVSVEGRIVAVLMRIYAVGVFGLIAGNLASVLLQRRQEQAEAQADKAK